jgi:hypothetical protein
MCKLEQYHSWDPIRLIGPIKETIDALVATLFTEKYKQGKGKPREGGLDYPVPYLIEKDGEVFCNPKALSENLNKQAKKRRLEGMGTGGYFTIPVKAEGVPSMAAPPSTTKKSSWCPRVGVHGILWRYYNAYALVPAGFDVSHLSNQKGRVTRGSLVAEDGVINRSRSACFQEGWYSEKKGDGVRCPRMNRYAKRRCQNLLSKNTPTEGKV